MPEGEIKRLKRHTEQSTTGEEMIYAWPHDDTNEPDPDELEELEDDSWKDRAYDLWADR